MQGASGGSASASSAVWTVPNLISFARIAAIPIFVALILDHDTSGLGIVVFGAVAATDWVDGWIARRTGQVSELGKILDPTADRLAVAAGLIALMVRGAFPVWAGLLILVRDVAVGLATAFVYLRRDIRIDVRFIGKVATFSLMVSVPWVSWGTLDLPLAEMALGVGWIAFALGIVESYVGAWAYAGDVRHALRS